jgi:hypothetical protein
MRVHTDVRIHRLSSTRDLGRSTWIPSTTVTTLQHGPGRGSRCTCPKTLSTPLHHIGHIEPHRFSEPLGFTRNHTITSLRITTNHLPTLQVTQNHSELHSGSLSFPLRITPNHSELLRMLWEHSESLRNHAITPQNGQTHLHTTPKIAQDHTRITKNT